MSVVPVLALGGVLATGYRAEARERGLAEGRSQAALVAQTAVQPILGDTAASLDALTPAQVGELQRVTSTSLASGSIVRLRLRDVTGRVVFSDDGSGFNVAPEDEAVEAAHGDVVARTTRLNKDQNDAGPAGTTVVEVYRPVQAVGSARPIGVLELYLPYRPIREHVTAGLHRLYFGLEVGLVVLWAILFLLSASVTRGLRRAARRNAHLAEHDPLTGLPNRLRFQREAEAAVTRGAAVLAIFDLDRFKEINDTLGHRTGDRILQELADRLSAVAPAGCAVARLGGDEFGVIVDGHGADGAHLATLRMLRAVLGEDVRLGDLTLAVEASVGYVVAPEHGVDADELLAHADVAMYAAKSRHGGIVGYDPALDHYDAANLGLVAALRTGIDEGQLVLHYQPKTDLSTKRLVAVEALVRWQHPELGLLPPDRFLPLAEQTDLMDPLTLAVLTAALRDARDIGLLRRGIAVAVNISARNLSRPEFAAEVVAILARLDVPAPLLTLEITETALLADPDRAALVLGQLAAAGVRISIDDFGAGQTSLGYLSALPVHELKIDRSFVSDMRTNGRHDAIVRSITELAHNLSLSVVAEGVETADVLAGLADASCDVAQGYFIARPMPADRLAEWVAAHLASTAPATVGGREVDDPERSVVR